jgi:hypothetical protein
MTHKQSLCHRERRRVSTLLVRKTFIIVIIPAATMPQSTNDRCLAVIKWRKKQTFPISCVAVCIDTLFERLSVTGTAPTRDVKEFFNVNACLYWLRGMVSFFHAHLATPSPSPKALASCFNPVVLHSTTSPHSNVSESPAYLGFQPIPI